MPTRELAAADLLAGAADILAEEILRDLHMDAGAVAGLAVGIDGAAVPDRLQRGDAVLDHLAARLAVERGDQPDAAGIVLVGGIVETVRRRCAAFMRNDWSTARDRFVQASASPSSRDSDVGRLQPALSELGRQLRVLPSPTALPQRPPTRHLPGVTAVCSPHSFRPIGDS